MRAQLPEPALHAWRDGRVTSILVAILAALFFVLFDSAKHNHALSAVNPFAEDPYDAVGSFAVQFAALGSLLALFRAFRPYHLIAADSTLLARTQILVVLSVLVTAAADAIALLRHVPLWAGSAPGYVLAGLTLGLGLLALAALAWLPRSRPRWSKHVLLLCIICALALVVFPETLRDSVPGELFTVVAGALVLFVPMRVLSLALVPTQNERPGGPRLSLLLPILLVGAVLGLGLFLSEAIGEGPPSELSRLALVAGVFIGLESTAVVIGYLLLERPLELNRLFFSTLAGLRSRVAR